MAAGYSVLDSIVIIIAGEERGMREWDIQRNIQRSAIREYHSQFNKQNRHERKTEKQVCLFVKRAVLQTDREQTTVEAAETGKEEREGKGKGKGKDREGRKKKREGFVCFFFKLDLSTKTKAVKGQSTTYTYVRTARH